jgi:hypothetical protein
MCRHYVSSFQLDPSAGWYGIVYEGFTKSTAVLEVALAVTSIHHTVQASIPKIFSEDFVVSGTETS